MRCEACNKNLTDREASRKYLNWREIKNTEERYIGLCDGCFYITGMSAIENPLASTEEFEDDTEVTDEQEDE